jgi:hypothetical protein
MRFAEQVVPDDGGRRAAEINAQIERLNEQLQRMELRDAELGAWSTVAEFVDGLGEPLVGLAIRKEAFRREVASVERTAAELAALSRETVRLTRG